MIQNNLRDIAKMGTAYMECTFSCNMDTLNNKDLINQFETDLRNNHIMFKSFTNPGTGGYKIVLRITNRSGLIYRKWLNFLSSVI